MEEVIRFHWILLFFSHLIVSSKTPNCLLFIYRLHVQLTWDAKLDATNDAEPSDDFQHDAGTIHAVHAAIIVCKPRIGAASMLQAAQINPSVLLLNKKQTS